MSSLLRSDSGLDAAFIRRLIGLLWQQRVRFLSVLLLMVLSAGLLILVPLWVKYLINEVLISQDLERIFRHLILGLFLFLGVLGSEFGHKLQSCRLANRVCTDMRGLLFRKIVKVPLQSLPDFRTGDLISRLGNDILVFNEGINSGFLSLVPNALIVVGLVALMITQSFWLLLLTLTLILPLALLSNLLLGKIKTHSRATQMRMASLNSALDETVRGMKEIRSGNQEQRIQHWYGGLNHVALQAQDRMDLFRTLNPAAVSSQVYVTTGVLVLLCSWMVLEGHMTIDRLTMFVTGLLLVFTPIQRLSRALGQLSRTAAVMDRFDALLNAPQEMTADERLPALPELRGDILFDGVNFAYERDFALRDVSFHIRAGETVAFIGASGSGKTTLLNLLFRFMDPDAGSIRLDELDIREYRIDSLRRQIGLVPQNPTIFDDTLLENLRFARPEADPEEIRRAAEAAQVAEFAETLELGYDTPVGQFGSRLSAGQRQRIAIARAFLQNPRILVLDEPTSALDGNTESLISETLASRWAGRTVLIVAHRPSTMRIADRILVVEDGRLRPATEAEYAQIRTPGAPAVTE